MFHFDWPTDMTNSDISYHSQQYTIVVTINVAPSCSAVKCSWPTGIAEHMGRCSTLTGQQMLVNLNIQFTIVVNTGEVQLLYSGYEFYQDEGS